MSATVAELIAMLAHFPADAPVEFIYGCGTAGSEETPLVRWVTHSPTGYEYLVPRVEVDIEGN